MDRESGTHMHSLAGRPPVVVALDYDELDAAVQLVERLRPSRCLTSWFKVGCQLFARYGRRAVDELLKRDCRVFVDLKVNGVPDTDLSLGRSIASWGVGLVDIHLTLGKRSMERFLEGVRDCDPRPQVLGVTVLTSHSDVATFGPDMKRETMVLWLAHLARESGLDGVVAAAGDVATIKREIGQDFLVVTPGIRPRGAPSHEQRQLATPKSAADAGADFLVIGRPITQATSPCDALAQIVAEVAGTPQEGAVPGASISSEWSWPRAITAG